MKKTSVFKIRVISGFFCTLIFLLVSCTWSKVHQVTEAQNGGEIILKVGDTLQISLAGNITTGFAWEIAENNANIMAAQGEREYQQEKTDLVGSGGTFIFMLKAITRGETTLKLIYHRSFEKDIPPAQEFILHIKVE
jgi:inhibitor of cysteine peptidase